VVPNLTPHGRVATSNGVVLWSMASASTPTPRHNRTQCGHSPAALYPRPLLPRARRPWPEPAHPHPAAACCSTPSTARARSSPRRRRRPSPGDERERERENEREREREREKGSGFQLRKLQSQCSDYATLLPPECTFRQGSWRSSSGLDRHWRSSRPAQPTREG
jgi:hypothetical protein